MSDIFIYGQIGNSFFEDGVTLADVQDQLGDDKEVTVHINSPGGDVREGYAIHDLLVNSGKKITTIIEGKCYSIATVPLLAGEIREGEPNSEGMIHNPWGQVEGDADKIKKYEEWIRETEEDLADFYSKKLGIDKEEIKDMMSDTTFMDADKMLDKGFITKIKEPMKAVALINTKQLTMDFSKEQKSTLKGFFDKVAEVLNPKEPKSISVKLENGAELFVETEDETLTGKKVFSDNKHTVVADGIYVLEDGRTATVASGVISVIEEKPEDNAEMDALKAKIGKLETDATEKAEQAEKEAKEAEAKSEAKLVEVQASLKEIQTMVFGDDPIRKPIVEKKEIGVDAVFQNWGELLINNR